MKKIAALLAALALLLNSAALAFEGAGYPAWDGTSAPDNGLCAAFGEDRISLAFDPSQEYSCVEDGLIQACFFAYDAAEEYFLELYLLLPQDVAAGDVLDEARQPECSICLYESSLGSDTFYCAGVTDGPEGIVGSYSLTLESVERSEAALSMRGQFSASLCRYAQDQPTRDQLCVEGARFSFTLPLTASAPTTAPGFPELPDDGFPTFPDASASAPAAVAPAFTLPPDYVVL